MPQVWSTIHERYWCAVYGDHTPRATYHTEPDVLFIRRDMNAPLAAVVDELAAMPYPTDIRRARKADYQRKNTTCQS